MEPAGSVAERLRIQAVYCERIGSPLYAGLLERAAADFEAGGPLADVLRGHEDDPADSMLALRLMGAVNRLVLRGVEPALGELYAAGERDPEAEWAEFRAVVEGNAAQLRELIERPVQTNEVGRCAALLPGFLAVATATGLPLRLLEVGASAGLNLRWDSYRYRAGDFAWGPGDSPVTLDFELAGEIRPDPPAAVEVAERRGCDAAPVDPATTEGRETLLAYVWPDQRARLERLRAALELAAGLPVAVDRESAAAWVERQLAEPAAGRATVVFHSIVFQYLSEAERAALESHLRQAAARATADAPLAWLRMEPADELAEVRLTVWPGVEERRLCRAGYHGSPVVL
ncbi:MAG TPA: DUF2332 domain-containing protein [Solirubrobacterales bacterium]|nr:DUF2332 domain-containing protein [Solirubrobacterales bacterium]